MGAGGHNFPPLQAGLDAKASGGNAHQALDVFALSIGLLLDKVGQLDGVFGTGGQCAAHGVQVAAKDTVIRGKAGRLKVRVLQHGLGWVIQFGMLLGVADAAQLAPYPIGAPPICWKVRMPHQLAQATACRAPSSAAVPASSSSSR